MCELSKEEHIKVPFWVAKWLEAFAESGRKKEACRLVGIGMGTAYKYGKAHRWFREEVEEIISWRCDEIEDTLYELASSGDLGAIKYMLGHMKPEQWSERVGVEQTINAIMPKVEVVYHKAGELKEGGAIVEGTVKDE